MVLESVLNTPWANISDNPHRGFWRKKKKVAYVQDS